MLLARYPPFTQDYACSTLFVETASPPDVQYNSRKQSGLHRLSICFFSFFQAWKETRVPREIRASKGSLGQRVNKVLRGSADNAEDQAWKAKSAPSQPAGWWRDTRRPKSSLPAPTAGRRFTKATASCSRTATATDTAVTLASPVRVFASSACRRSSSVLTEGWGVLESRLGVILVWLMNFTNAVFTWQVGFKNLMAPLW